MRYVAQLRDEPGGAVVVGLGVRVRRHRDGVTITNLTSDANGLVTYQESGHQPPFFFETANTAGGPRLWSSMETMTSGALSPAEIPHVLRAMGDGTLPNDGGFGLSISGTTLSVAAGVALVQGYPVILYETFSLTTPRPTTGTRIDRIVARVYPMGATTDPGYADVALVAGEVDAGAAPALVQTANEWQIPLWSVTVPIAGTLTAEDDREAMLAGYLTRHAEVAGEVQVSSAVGTSSGAGEVPAGLSFDLVLPAAATYDVAATYEGVHLSDLTGLYTYSAKVGASGTGNGQFGTSSPRGVAVTSGGSVWVTDRGNHRLQQFTSALVYSAQSGSLGSGNGQFNLPNDIAIDSGGNLFVADTVNNRIQKFNSSGVYTSQFGTTGSGNGQFNQPLGLDIKTTSGRIYVADLANSRVQYFTSGGVYEGQWGGNGSADGRFAAAPAGIAVNQTSGVVYVADTANYRVQGFSATGVFSLKFGSYGADDGQFLAPLDVAVHPTTGNVFVVDFLRCDVQEFTAAGVFVRKLGSSGTGDGQFVGPTAMAFDATGDALYVTDASGFRIEKFVLGTSGYGTVAVRIDGNLGTYLGIGNREGSIANTHTRAISGPDTITIEAYGKATSGTMGLRSSVLSAVARPRS